MGHGICLFVLVSHGTSQYHFYDAVFHLGQRCQSQSITSTMDQGIHMDGCYCYCCTCQRLLPLRNCYCLSLCCCYRHTATAIATANAIQLLLSLLNCYCHWYCHTAKLLLSLCCLLLFTKVPYHFRRSAFTHSDEPSTRSLMFIHIMVLVWWWPVFIPWTNSLIASEYANKHLPPKKAGANVH